MDLSLPIIGLVSFFGYNLNKNGITPRTTDKKINSVDNNQLPNGANIYKSNKSVEVKKDEQARGDLLFKQSKNPSKTRVIPPLFNQNSNDYIENEISLNDRYRQKVNNSLFGGNSTIPTSNNQSINSNSNNQIKAIGGFGPIINNFTNVQESFKPLNPNVSITPHNNMLPHFKGHVKQNIGLSTHKLDHFGGFKMLPEKKKEHMNNLPTNKQNIYGTPAFTLSVDQDRFIPSNKLNNVLPFEQIKQQPIPEHLLRPKVKNIDELRIEGNPRVSYGGRFLPAAGINNVYNRGEINEVKKNKPNRFFDNSQYRFTTGGVKTSTTGRGSYTKENIQKAQIAETQYEYGPKYNPQFNKNLTNRNFKKLGVSDKDNTDILTTYYENDKKIDTHIDYTRNIGSKLISNKQNEFARNNITLREQERETIDNYPLMNARTDVKQTYVSREAPKDTNKQYNLYEFYGNAKNATQKPLDYSADNTREPINIMNENYIPNGNYHVEKQNTRYQFENQRNNSNREEITNLKGRMNIGNKQIGLSKDQIGQTKQKNDINKSDVYKNGFTFNYSAGNSSGLNINRIAAGHVNNKTSSHNFTDRIGAEYTSNLKNNPYALQK